MKFYNQYYANNFEELITYYPRFYRDVFEMVEILKANGKLLDGLEENIERVYFNNFIDFADNETLTKLERFLGIGLGQQRGIEERRRYIKAFFIGGGKVSAALLKEMISTYTEAEVSIELKPYDETGNNWLIINCQCLEGDTFTLSDVNSIISQKIPAHIMYVLRETFAFETDFSQVEQFVLRNMHLHTVVPFWQTRYFDGSEIMDGSHLMDAARDYDLRLGVIYGMGEAVAEEKFVLAGATLCSEVPLEESVEMGTQLVSGAVVSWQPLKYYKVTAIVGAVVSVCEEFGNATVRTQRNVAYFDGSLLMDGSHLMNSIDREEEI